MATDFNKPVVTDAYATLLPGLVTANKDLAMMLEPTLTGTSTNLPTGAVRWNATTIRWERYNGTAWVTLPAAGNNVYAISISGNAATTTALATARTIGGVSFDGTANINLPGVNAAGNQNTTGNAATATKLATARTIGGVSFDGTANINLPGVNITGNQDTTGNAATATVASAAPWSGITSKPTTVAGYGITDMASQTVANATSATNVTGTAGLLGYSTAGAGIAYGGAGGPQVMNQGTGAAMLTFNRSGYYAVNFGLDTDNQLSVGGFSMGAVSHKIVHSGNIGSYATAPTTAQVAAATAGVQVGDVGSYAYLSRLGPVGIHGSRVTAPGTTLAGSSLAYSGAPYGNPSIQPAGTWRCMGHTNFSGGPSSATPFESTVWLRIA